MLLALELIKKYAIPQVLIHIYKPTLDMLAETFLLREAVHVYSPASDVDILVSVRSLEIAPRFEIVSHKHIHTSDTEYTLSWSAVSDVSRG